MSSDETPRSITADAGAVGLLSELLRRTHLSSPSEIGSVIVEQAADTGVADVEIYVVDYEQRGLMPLAGGGDLEPLTVTGTMAGRCFTTTSVLRSSTQDGRGEHLWLPLLDGTERMGVMGMTFPPAALSERLIAVCERYAHLAAMLLVTKTAYGDAIELAKRRQPMTIASELLWALAPPLLFATDDVVLTGMLEPCYDNGGDGFDYAVNGSTLHFAVFDAMGHGLAAAGMAAFALSAYRYSRRRRLSLVETYESMDAAVSEQYPDERYVTALVAELDLTSGLVRWVSAGHPPPLLIRRGRRAHVLGARPSTPLGVPSIKAPAVADEALEPGDLLLAYSDGLTEARRPDGSMLAVDGLSAFIEREAAAGQTVPETLRRLRHTIVDDTDGELRDDATAVLVQWRGGGERALLPQTAD